MPRVLTVDRKWIEWEHAEGLETDIITTALPAATVRSLVEGDCAHRCVAMSKLSRAQLVNLYRGTAKQRDALLWARIGRRIRDTNTLEYATGLGRQKIIRIYCKAHYYSNRKRLIEVLLAES